MQTLLTRTNIISLAAVIVITLTLASNALFAEWSAPSSAPPDSNVATPVHTGAGNQIKGGSIAAGEGRLGANQFVAYDKVRSEEYCDLNGDNCINTDYIQLGQMVPNALPLSEAQSICGDDGHRPYAGASSQLTTRSGLSSSLEMEDGRFVLGVFERFWDASHDGYCSSNTCTLSNYGTGWELHHRGSIWRGDCI